MKKALRWLLLGWGMAVAVISADAVSADGRARLLFVSDESYPPYTYMEGGAAKGMGVELVQLLSGRLGRPIEFRLMRWEDAQQQVLRGEADALFPMSITEARKQQFDFSDPVLDLEYSVFTRAEQVEIIRLADLRGLRVAVTASGLPRQLLDAEGGMTVRIVQDHAQGFQLLLKGEVDAVFGDRWVGGYELARRSVTGVRIADEPVARLKAAVAVRHGNDELLREINRALRTMQTDGTIDRTLLRWRSKEVVFLTRDQMQRWEVGGVIGMLLLALGVMVWRLKGQRREVLERRQAEERIVALNQRLSVATRSAGIGVWDWDVENDVLVWDEEMYRLYRVPSESKAVAHQVWVKALHPEDRERALADTRAALKGAKPFDTEFRIVWPDGAVRVMQASAQTFLGADGRPLRMVGVNFDITERKRAEENLRASEKRLRALSDHLPDSMVYRIVRETDGAMRFVYVSSGVERVNGVSAEAVLSDATVLYRQMSEVDRARAEEMRRASEREMGVFELEVQMTRPDGDVRWVQISSTPHRLPDGRMAWDGLELDITRRRRAEEARLKSEEKFAKAFRSSPVAIAVTNPSTGRFVEVNDSMERFLGYRREELIGRTTLELNLWINPEARQRMIDALANRGWIRDEEVHFRPKGGGEVVSQYSAEPIEIEGERHVLSVLVDITARKRAQEERLRLVHDLGERIKELTALHRMSRLLQADRPFDQALLAELVSILPPAWQYPDVCEARVAYGDVEAVTAGWREAPWKQSSRFATSDGRSGMIEVIYREEQPAAAEGPFLAEERSLIESLGEMLATHLERRSAAEALGRSEARFRSAMVNSAVGMAIVATDGRWLEINPALCRIVGYSREEMLARDFQAVTHPEDLEKDLTYMRDLLAGSVETLGWEKRYLHKDGYTVWIQINVSVVRDGRGCPTNFVTLVQDISARKAAEASLAAAAERLSLALQVSKLGVWRHNLQTRQTEWDDRMFVLFGLPENEYAPSYDQILGRVLEEDRVVVQRAWNASPACDQAYHMRFRVARAGGGHRHVDVQGIVHNDVQGRPEWALGVAADITDIVESAAESERLRTQLQQSQKMETLGTLAAGVAHDFNNLLTGINGFVDLATTSLPPDHEATNLLKQARRGAMSARDLVRRILDFSRMKTARERVRVDIGGIVRDTAALLSAVLPGRVSVSLDITSDQAFALADAGQIQQVLMNFCTNGAHAIGDRAGTLRIHVCVCEFKEGDELPPSLSGKSGHYVRLAVTDSGAGMDEATKERLFEPFFTTKKPGEGTGLGLSIVRDIVTAHGGGIEVASKRGSGTTFSIYLPLASSEVEAECTPTSDTAKGEREQGILIVDDEPSVAMVLRLALQKNGYRPEMYTSPAAAWKRFAAAPGAFDLLLIDQNMPEISGREFVQRARAAAPDIRVIVLSGRFEHTRDNDILTQSGIVRLQKPFEIIDLLGSVESLLSGARDSTVLQPGSLEV